jgi:hypothetical protein
MAAVGALLVSSGLALMAAPTTASAAQFKNDHQAKIVVCKYVGTPGESRLQTGNNPIVVSQNTLRHLGWDGTFPFAWTDAHGQAGHGSMAIGYVGDVAPVIQSCPGYEPDQTMTDASLDVVDPSCANGNTASFTVTGEHVYLMWAKVNGHQIGEVSMGQKVTVEPGDSIQVKVHAVHGYKFDKADPGSAGKTKTMSDTVGAVEVNCTAVTPAAPTFVDPTCTTAPAVQTPASELVTYAVTGSQVAGGTVHVVATLKNSETSHFAEGAVTTWDHTFTTPTGCGTVSPPAVAPTTEVSPPKTHVKHKTEVKAETTTPTVVKAGLAGTTTDTSLQTGLGLALAGLALMAGAAGLVLVGGGKDEDTA